MMFFFALLLCTMGVVLCYFPVPDGNVRFCFDFECFKSHITSAQDSNVIVAAIISFSINEDSYTSLYLGHLLNLFDLPTLNILTVVLESPKGINIIETGATALMLLNNTKSIFVGYEHGFSSIGLKNIEILKRSGFGPTVLLHLNHERPWQLAQNETENGKVTQRHFDHIYSSVEELTASYDLHPLVLRNYYYSPLSEHSYYLPAGVPFYNYLLGKGKKYDSVVLKRASQRGTRCHFKGRLNYFFVLLGEDSAVATSTEQTEEEESHVTERKELLRLSLEGRSGGCVAEEYDPLRSDPGSESFMSKYERYVEQMADTAFALCPSGNNPETFRHYEALELGAIPVLIRPSSADRDFLRHKQWVTYPGPVLSSWTELDAFMSTVTPQYADALQERVQQWYSEFKRSTKANLERVLSRALYPEHSDDRDGQSESSFSHYAGQFQEERATQTPEVTETATAVHLQGVVSSTETRQCSGIEALTEALGGLERRLAAVEAELLASRARERQLLNALLESELIK